MMSTSVPPANRKELRRFEALIVAGLVAVVCLASVAPLLHWTHESLLQNAECFEKELQGEDRESEQLPLWLADHSAPMIWFDDVRFERVVELAIGVLQLEDRYSHPLRGPPSRS
jgi:hypothetical protein